MGFLKLLAAHLVSSILGGFAVIATIQATVNAPPVVAVLSVGAVFLAAVAGITGILVFVSNRVDP